MSRPIHSVVLFLTKGGISYTRRIPLGIRETLSAVIRKTIAMKDCDGFSYVPVGKEPKTFYFGVGGKLDDLRKKAPLAYTQIHLITMGALDEDKELWTSAVYTRLGRVEVLRPSDIVLDRETGEQTYPVCIFSEEEKNLFRKQA